VRFWIAGMLALLATSLALVRPADAGLDEAYQKPQSDRSWGDLLRDFVGYRGFSRSYALIVGISDFNDYPNLPTTNDPIRMRDFLVNEAGYDYVYVLTDDKATKARIDELMVDVLPAMMGPNDQFLFYWSGHGEQRPNALGGQIGYLPVAASLKDRYSTMVSMGDIQRWDALIEAKQALFLLDACFSGLAGAVSQSGHRDLQIAQLAQPAHQLVTAGTGEQQTVAGDRWGGSVFTDAVLRAVRGEADAQTTYGRDGVVSFSELIGYVKTRVAAEAAAAGWSRPITPQPRDLRASTGEFFFLTSEYKVAKLRNAGGEFQERFEGGMPVVIMGEAPAPACDREADRLFWEAIENESAPGYFEAYLKRVESGELCGLFADIARLKLEPRVAALPSEAQPAPDPAAAEIEPNLAVLESARRNPEQAVPVQPAVGVYEERGQYQVGDEFRDCNECPLMVVVPPGSFMMGSTEAEREWAVEQGADRSRVGLEKPQHPVTIAEPFAVGKHEITFDEWDACVKNGGCNGYKPADEGWGRRLRPVINVSWKDARAYAEWLSEKTGDPYRLLSESEWEYAARAGTTTRFSWGDAITRKNANYGGYLGKTAEVGSYPPGPWGLYDMHGNVWEWGEDCIYNSYVGAPNDGSPWTIGGCGGGRVGRGGSWGGDPGSVRSAVRGWSGTADHREKFAGFRVARDLTP
jgi:formylglycine-generating enzyme required for sulfatase activity